MNESAETPGGCSAAVLFMKTWTGRGCGRVDGGDVVLLSRLRITGKRFPVDRYLVTRTFLIRYDTAVSDVVRISITAPLSVKRLHVSRPITRASRVTQGLKEGSGVTARSGLCSLWYPAAIQLDVQGKIEVVNSFPKIKKTVLGILVWR